MAFIRQRGKKRLWTLVDEARNYYEPLKTDNEKLANLALKQYESEQFLASQGLQVPGQKKKEDDKKTFVKCKDDYLSMIKSSTQKHCSFIKAEYVLNLFQSMMSPEYISDVDMDMCERWQNQRLNMTYKKSKDSAARLVMPSTVATERSYLSPFFEKMRRLGHISVNPFEEIEKIGTPDSLPKALAKDRQAMLYTEYKKESIRLENPLIMIGFLLELCTMRRVSEIVHICWENVDKSGRWYKLCRIACECADCKENDGVYTPKNRNEIMVPVNDEELTSLLVKHRQPSGRVLNLSKSGFSQLSRRVFDRAGINDRGVLNHSLRHSGATNEVIAGTPLKAIQQIMNHKTIVPTTIYTQMDVKQLAGSLKFKRPSLLSPE